MANDDSVFVAQGDGVSIFVLDNDEIVGEAGVCQPDRGVGHPFDLLHNFRTNHLS